MRISVIGVGAVGGALAALLDRAGHDVVAVARGTTLAEIDEHGMRLSGARGNHTARVRAQTSPDPASDLIIVAVRSFQTSEAVAPHRAVIGDLPVLVVENGLDGPQDAALTLGRETQRGVLGGIALFAATNAGPGVVTLTASGRMRVGAANPADAALAARIAAVINDAFPTTTTGNLAGALWMKLLVNHVNALPAITGRSVQATCTHPLLAPVLAASLTESVRIADAIGVRFEAVGVLTPRHAARIRQGAALEVVRGRLARAFGFRPNPASTLQSIRRGQPTEIADLNGAVVRAGERVRIPAPINTALVDLVHEVERTGQNLSPVELRRRLPR